MKTALKSITCIILALILSASLFSCGVVPNDPSDKTTDPVDDVPPTDTDGESEKVEEYIPPESYDFIIRNSNGYKADDVQYLALKCGEEMAFGASLMSGHGLEKTDGGTLAIVIVESLWFDTSIEDPQVPHVMYSLENDTVTVEAMNCEILSDYYIPIGGSKDDKPLSRFQLVPGQTYYRIIEARSGEPESADIIEDGEIYFVGLQYFHFLVTIV